MKVGLRTVVLVALLAGGCAGGEDSSPAPTSPTPPPPPATAPPPPPPANSCLPGAATNLRSTLSGSTRTLSWTAGANATDYDIQIGSASGFSDLVRDNTTHTSYQWTGAGSGTNQTFYARVHSHNACGSGPASVELAFN